MENKTKDFLLKWIVRIFLIIFTLFFMYPLFWNLMSSFKTNAEFLMNQVSFPKQLEWDNYVRAFTKANMGAYVFNSFFVVALSSVLLLFFVIPVSYALARYRFFGSGLIEAVFMMCIFIQVTYIMVPLYVRLNSLNMIDSLPALSLVYAVTSFPFSIFLLAGFMRTISKSFEESARIDGCSNWRILISIIIPLAKSGIATVTMLAAMGFWNEYPLALVLIRSEGNRTLPIGLAHLFQVQRRATDFGALFAALVIVLVPTIGIYLVGQRYLLKGISAGGLKE
jgi:N-acetylglucosamine transport system permease protein